MNAHLNSTCRGKVPPRLSRLCRSLALVAVMLLWGCSLDRATPPGGDSSADQSVSDLRTPDTGNSPDTSKDQIVPKDYTAPDQGVGGVVLVQGSFSTGGSGSAGNIVLVESGFELGETQCVGNICLTGGIVP